MIKRIEGGVTAAKGFKAASCAAGIKYEGRQDMALIYSEVPCRQAGTFTSNIVKAAPVKWDQQQVEGSVPAQAVVVNAGIANACTGKEGMDYCRQTAQAASEALSIPPEAVLVASTGVIGRQLPMDRIKAGVKEMAGCLSGTLAAGEAASRAIMTTDTKNKQVAVEVELSGKRAVIGGMCKGSGDRKSVV